MLKPIISYKISFLLSLEPLRVKRWIASINNGMVVHDTKCPYQDQVSLNNRNSTSLQISLASPPAKKSSRHSPCSVINSKTTSIFQYFTGFRSSIYSTKWHVWVKLATDQGLNSRFCRIFTQLSFITGMPGEKDLSWLVIASLGDLDINSYSASHDSWCTGTLWNRIMTAQCEGIGEVGSARYELALLPPCPSIRVLSYSNCQEIHSRQQTGLAV